MEMVTLPSVDVNMVVYNSVSTVGSTIESVLKQTWPAVSLTVIDNASTDGTFDVVQHYAKSQPAIRVRRNRCNTGNVINIQRAFWFGEADYVMVKTGDDLIAPDYIERLMAVLLKYPRCVMCHAAGLVFTGANEVRYQYPPEHCLEATDPDLMVRAKHVMRHYSSAPSFWGVYRRDAVDQLSMFRYRAGFDHTMLAELALYGEIRHIAEPLFWRRDGGRSVLAGARASTEQGNRGVPLDDVLAEHRWRTPLITTAYTHMEMFAAVRLPLPQRLELMRSVPEIFRARWLPRMQQEAASLRAWLPGLLDVIASAHSVEANWLARTLTEVLLGAQALLPEEDFTLALLEVAAAAGEPHRAPA
jgi:glycosyltransferase involved in cell wall biosynthesis